jgi:metallo-beta-lactamase family protein
MTGPALSFWGATRTVTGSRFLVEDGATRVLVDAGLYQGLRELRDRNWAEFPIDPTTLTHAHLDHCGYLPRLVKQGFVGPVLCSAGTAELAKIVLRDSATLQEEDAAYMNRAGFSKHSPALPLYDAKDAEATISLFRPVEFGASTQISERVSVTLHPAGHILGSSIAHIRVGKRSVLFSGDLGRPYHPLLKAPADPPEADFVVIESTYGDRRHPEPDPSVLADAITRTIQRGGSVLIPAFAVDRTELVLMELKRLISAHEIPDVPVFVDSPMALATLDVYRRAVHNGWSEVREQSRPDPFDPGHLRPVKNPTESEQLNEPTRPCIIVSASGMATGGRVVHHLKHQLPNPKNTVILTGYQAIGTRGRALLDGATEVKMHGRYVPVKAEIVNIANFSVHADGGELIGWLSRMPMPPQTVFVVHGEEDSSKALAEEIRHRLHWTAVIPHYRERIRID